MSQNCGGRRLGYDDPAYAYYSPWNLPAQDGIEQDNSSPELACRTMITIPDWLQDGKYVMQWVMCVCLHLPQPCLRSTVVGMAFM